MSVVTLFVGTYTREESFVNGKGKGIYSFTFNTANGTLTPLAVTENLGINPSFICGNKTNLYAVNECDEPLTGAPDTSTGYIVSMAIEDGGKLRELNRFETKGAASCHVSLSKDNDFLTVSNYMGGNLILFPLNQADGSLAEASDFHQFTGAALVNTDRQEAPHMHSTTWVPGADFAFACDLGNDRVTQFVLDKTQKKLVKNPAGEFAMRPAGNGPRHMAIHPTAKVAYVLDELSSTIGVHSYDPTTGSLSSEAIQNISTLPKDFTGANLTADIHISTCGKFVYASNRGHDSIACYHILASNNGKLEFLELEPTRGRSPRNFLIYENFILVANQDTDTIEVFHIDAISGKLTFTGNNVECPTPVSLFIVPK